MSFESQGKESERPNSGTVRDGGVKESRGDVQRLGAGRHMENALDEKVFQYIGGEEVAVPFLSENDRTQLQTGHQTA
jgi:hypothetical protein